MKLTAKGRYTIRALSALVYLSEGKAVSLKTIAAHESISLNFLEQIFIKLRRKGIVKSIKGPGGGYVINGAMKDISLKSVLNAVGEPIEPARCAEDKMKQICRRQKSCITQMVMFDLGHLMNDFLEGITLDDVYLKMKSGTFNYIPVTGTGGEP